MVKCEYKCVKKSMNGRKQMYMQSYLLLLNSESLMNFCVEYLLTVPVYFESNL